MKTERDIITEARGRGLTWRQIEAELHLREEYLRRRYRDIPRFFVKIHVVKNRLPPDSLTPDERHLRLLIASGVPSY